MDISIIIDKSTFQSLNYNELYRLSCYYKHIITPVLTMEILGDLKKETTLPEDRVKDFANKLFPTETIVNLHYKVLVKEDLQGNKPSMDGRPNVSVNKTISSSSGQKGYLLKETEEEASIYKWKDGNFTEADKELSKLWRMTTTNEEILTRLKESLKTTLPSKIKDFEQLNNIVNQHLSNPDNQYLFLIALMQNYEIDAANGLSIFNKWNIERKPLLSNFAPYAFHCLRVDTLFLFGLASGLIGTRPTNRVDLEYLYYQPFGHLFTSNDKVHLNLAPLLLRPYQKFLLGSDLKKDLKSMVEHLELLETKERQKFKNCPPIIENSITFQLWKEHFDYPENNTWNREIPKEEMEMVKGKLKEFELALDSENIELKPGEDAEFILRKSSLGKNDPCFCGSNKRVIDCCIPEKEFNAIAIKEMEKEWNKRNGK